MVRLAAIIVLAGGMTLTHAADFSRVDVTETGGVYSVAAAFAVKESPAQVMAVLTDFERIPSYVPGMEISRVVERTAAGMVVEQQAVSKFMMFSKRVHLMLDVRTQDAAIRFRDRCGRSFAEYEGSWLISQHDSLTVVDYHLSARPSFEVPGFVLKRLFKRDAGLLIDRIKAEIAARGDRRQ
jgi:ribosome-associated toxin RatA of RatAB toxin-antitoxin module